MRSGAAESAAISGMRGGVNTFHLRHPDGEALDNYYDYTEGLMVDTSESDDERDGEEETDDEPKTNLKTYKSKSSFSNSKTKSSWRNEVDYADDSALIGTCARLPLLEALNMSLDAFEQHTLDRRLTMTGQAIFVITANHGVVFSNAEL